jgi:hypothetical protein
MPAVFTIRSGSSSLLGVTRNKPIVLTFANYNDAALLSNRINRGLVDRLVTHGAHDVTVKLHTGAPSNIVTSVHKVQHSDWHQFCNDNQVDWAIVNHLSTSPMAVDLSIRVLPAKYDGFRIRKSLELLLEKK